MGIPRFYRYVSHKYPEVVKYASQFHPVLDNLFVDANGIIHTVVKNLYFPSVKRLAPRATPLKFDQAVVFRSVLNQIDHLVKLAAPRKLVYVALDGVAPVAKQAQQRQRRYKSALDKSAADLALFDTCSITAGTKFMKDLGQFLTRELKAFQRKYQITVLFSSSEVAGEGEHKLIEYVHQLSPHQTHCFYGLDADLFMLAFASQHPHFYLLREDFVSSDHVFVNLEQLAELIRKDWSWADDQTLLNDFVVLGFLIGNDFLPALKSFHNLEISFEFLLQKRKENKIALTFQNRIHFFNLFLFLSYLQPYEESMIGAQYFNRGHPDLLLNNALRSPRAPEQGINIQVYQKEYHQRFPNVSRTVENYLLVLNWVNDYYHGPPHNWTLQYTFHDPPLIGDLVENGRIPLDLPASAPLSPHQQLLCVVPKQSKALLPAPLRKLYTHPELDMYFPEQFTIDHSGKVMDYEGVALLPFIDLAQIQKWVK